MMIHQFTFLILIEYFPQDICRLASVASIRSMKVHGLPFLLNPRWQLPFHLLAIWMVIDFNLKKWGITIAH
jgi:hypothetical protein